MNANDLLTTLCQLVFSLLGVLTAIDYARKGGVIRRDIALAFGSVALPFIIQLAVPLFGPQSSLIALIGSLGFLAQPYFLLRLARYFQPIPNRHMRWAFSMFVGSELLLISAYIIPSLAVVAVILVIVHFIVLNTYTMRIFIRGARARAGVVRQRLRFAATGSGLLAVTLLGLLIASILSRMDSVTVFVPLLTLLMLATAVFSGIGFYLAFATPRWLRRAWQLTELHQYLLHTFSPSPEGHQSIASNLQTLCASAENAVGGTASAVAQYDAITGQWTVRCTSKISEPLSLIYDIQSPISNVWKNRTPTVIHKGDPIPSADRLILDSAHADSLLVLSISTPTRVLGLLLVFQQAGSLFPDDDLDILTMFAQQAAVMLENDLLVEQLHRHSNELEDLVAERSRELEASQTQYRQFVETAQEGVWVSTLQNITYFANQKMAEMLGTTPEDMVGTSTLRFVDKEEHESVARHRAERNKGIYEQYELKMVRTDGSSIWTLVSATPLYDDTGAVYGSLAMVADITRLKTAEAELLQLNASLEKHVADRTLELSNLNRELEAFSYSVSHDLRAPLRSIDGFSQAVIEDYGAELNPNALKMLQRVRAGAQRMAALIDDLLNLARISRGSISLQQFDLSSLVQTVITELQQRDPDRVVAVAIQTGMLVHGDSRLLRIVLDNLLGNAWKFTRQTQNAKIEVCCENINDETVYSVSDNGAGFDMAYADKLFGAFQRLHSTNEFEGIGIGLATVQRIVARHGGRVWGHGELHNGATFSFTLPSEFSTIEEFA